VSYACEDIKAFRIPANHIRENLSRNVCRREIAVNAIFFDAIEYDIATVDPYLP